MAAESCWRCATERGEDGDERADDVAAGLGFGLTDLARGGGAEAGEQVGRRPPATVGVLAEELGEAFFTQARGAVGGGIATEEGQGDGRVDVGEDGGGPGPEPLEQGAELIGEGDALGDEIVPTAYEGAQGTRVVRGRPPRPEAMAIGPQQIGEDGRIAGVTLAAGGGVAWAAGLERVGVDRYDLHPGLDEGIDEQAGGAFERDPKGAAVEQAPQAAEQLREPLGGVGDGALPLDAARVVKDADRVGLTRPVDPDEESHCVASGGSETLRGERSGRSLTDWRSGLLGHVARHPVAGLGLSSFNSGEQVSCWPSRGERTWLSPNLSMPVHDAVSRRPRPSNAIAHCLPERRPTRRPYLDTRVNEVISRLPGRVVQ